MPEVRETQRVTGVDAAKHELVIICSLKFFKCFVYDSECKIELINFKHILF